ncbi:MAG: acyl-CoA dehydrogenase family protein [Actinomycetota bacterium]
MDWSFTEEQEQVAALTRHILERELNEERRRSAGPFDKGLYRTLTDAGVLDASLGLIELCRVLIEIGRAVAPVPAAASAIARRVAPVEASLPTLALSEELNPDLETPMTRAARKGDVFVLSGAKTTVPAGPFADLFVVSASLDDGTPGLFAVPRRSSGVDVQEQVVTSTDREAVLELNDVEVPAAHRLGGAEALKSAIDHITVALCAVQLGVCERALELTAEYSKQRVQFDRPIATFQAVGQRLADAFIDVEAIRLTLWQAAWRLSEGLPSDTEIATAKFWASDAGHRVAHTAVHVHGGVGIDLDHALHRYFVAAKRTEFALGGATEHLVVIGKALADEPA